MNHNPLYHEFALEYGRAVAGNAYNAHYERPSLCALLPPLDKLSVLDLGCGPGAYTKLLLQQGARVTAVDGSQAMIDIVRRQFPGLRCYVQDLAGGLPAEDSGSFDLVIAPLTLHYLRDWQPPLRDIRRVLKPDGVFVFSTHHPFFDYQRERSGSYYATELIEEQWDTVGHAVAVSFYRRPLSAMMSALVEAGLRVETLTEGQVARELADIDPVAYDQLRREPAFIFFRCRAD